MKKQLEGFKSKLLQIPEESLIKKIMIRQIEEKILYFELLYKDVKIELAKTGKYEITEDIDKILKEIDDLNTKLYGPKTIDNPDLIKRIYWKVKVAFEDGNKNDLKKRGKAINGKIFEKGKKLQRFKII